MNNPRIYFSWTEIQSKSKINCLQKISYPWILTVGYLTLVLLLPITALVTKSLTIGMGEFWQEATEPVAISAYEVTFVTALAAGLINGIMETLIAIALIYLLLLLFLPAIAIFYQAFHQGINAFLSSISQREFWQAIQLTLTVVAIAVPLNTIFGLCAENNLLNSTSN